MKNLVCKKVCKTFTPIILLSAILLISSLPVSADETTKRRKTAIEKRSK